MRKYKLKFLVLSFFIVFGMSPQLLAWAGQSPIIHIDPLIHSFPAIFEGETISHDFKVFNKGSADLEIKDVTHQ